MLSFLQRYRYFLFAFLPVLLIIGRFGGPLAIPVAAFFVFYAYSKDRHDVVIIVFLVSLLLGDSRVASLQFIKPIRVVLLIMMTGFTINDIRMGKYQLNRQMIYFLPFIFLAFFGLLASPSNETNSAFSSGFVKTLSYILLYFVAFHYFRHQMITYGVNLLRDLVLLFTLALFIGLFLIPFVPEIPFYKGGIRYNGLLGNPNGMGVYLVLNLPIVVYYFLYSKEKNTGLKWFLGILFVISLLLCSSRNALFATALFMGLIYGLQGGNLRKAMVFLGVLPAIGFLIFNIDLEAFVVDLGLEKYLRLRDFKSGSGRIYAWEFALDIFRENPMFGCGFFCEEWKFHNEMSYYLWRTGHQGGVHNSFLSFLMNIGILGTTAFLSGWAAVISRAPNLNFLLPYVAICLFSATFESWMISSLNTFTVYFLIMSNILLIERRTNIFQKLE